MIMIAILKSHFFQHSRVPQFSKIFLDVLCWASYGISIEFSCGWCIGSFFGKWGQLSLALLNKFHSFRFSLTDILLKVKSNFWNFVNFCALIKLLANYVFSLQQLNDDWKLICFTSIKVNSLVFKLFSFVSYKYSTIVCFYMDRVHWIIWKLQVCLSRSNVTEWLKSLELRCLDSIHLNLRS